MPNVSVYIERPPPLGYVDALKWTGRNISEAREFIPFHCGTRNIGCGPLYIFINDDKPILVYPGDYIVMKGNRLDRICDEETFANEYELAEHIDSAIKAERPEGVGNE